MIHYIDEVEDLKGKKVLLRLDLNVPVVEGQVADTYRLERVIQTIDFLRFKEAQVIVIAHIESTEGTLLPVWQYFNGYFPVEFCPTYFTPEATHKLLEMKDRDVLLFENIRNNPGEKTNDSEFAKKIAQMADMYVNDAFGASHRQHASIVGVPQFLPHYGGFLMREEIQHLSKVFNPEHPFIFILGGAKFDTKLPIIKKYLEKADYVFVAGALGNNLFKAHGFNVGTSLVSVGDFGEHELIQNPKLIVPIDVTVQNIHGQISFKNPNEVSADDYIADVGPKTIDQLKKLLNGSKTIVWNGPLGYYENYPDKTEQLAEIIAEETKKGSESIVGGGDTIASINTLGLEHTFSFISTGGGAMLDFLVDETLPGIEALN